MHYSFQPLLRSRYNPQNIVNHSTLLILLLNTCGRKQSTFLFEEEATKRCNGIKMSVELKLRVLMRVNKGFYEENNRNVIPRV